MAVEVSVGTPLATALQNVVQPRLAEVGWTTGGLDDSALSEYIILMLANGKTQEQIASELSNDLLGLGPEDDGAVNFSRWLFQQVDILSKQLNGSDQAGASSAGESGSSSNQNSQSEGANGNGLSINHDAEMRDTAEAAAGAIPTGPKAMRNGSATHKPRDKRMLGQLNKAMDRSDDSALHKVRGATGTGRINSHSGREPPRGPRSQLNRGIAAMANGRGMGAMGTMGGMNGMPVSQLGSNGPMNPLMSPQQQMALLQMYEQQAQLMQQLFSGPTPMPFINPNFQGTSQAQSGKSLFDRVDHQSQRQNDRRHPQHSNKFAKKEQQDEAMMDSVEPDANGVPSSSMDVEVSQSRSSLDASQTMCKFNLSCTKTECLFVHQSPAAPPGTSVDMSDTCPFAAACMNKKCVGKHPSPAQRQSHKAEQDCVFYPNCRDQQNCPFRHPSMPPCRNGADCTVSNCKFAHSKVMCKFNPCKNAYCPFKHADGQKRGSFEDKVWTPSHEKKEHVSERKFVDEDGEEELILPGRSSQEVETQIIT